jgi:hypothetical protein
MEDDILYSPITPEPQIQETTRQDIHDWNRNNYVCNRCGITVADYIFYESPCIKYN